MKNDGRVICPKCGNDLGPVQPLQNTLTGCRKCRVWVSNTGEAVDPHERFKAWQQHKEQLKHEKEQHKKYVKAHNI
jgi:DNA-directed RNA polymerase subunit M/transcription elongation factor TFIIS